jgi:hypothetical protein
MNTPKLNPGRPFVIVALVLGSAMLLWALAAWFLGVPTAAPTYHARRVLPLLAGLLLSVGLLSRQRHIQSRFGIGALAILGLDVILRLLD